MSNRQTRPPVTDPNPPRARRTPPPDDSNAVEQPGVSATVTNVGTNVGNPVPAGGPRPPMSLAALLHGRVDPEQDRGQTGVRLPRYVTDAVRMVAATSRGTLTMQDIVTEAVKQYLPADLLHQAWVTHGGDPDGGRQ